MDQDLLERAAFGVRRPRDTACAAAVVLIIVHCAVGAGWLS